MYKRGSLIVYSPGDLSRFFDSRFATWMERLALEVPGELEPDPDGEDLQMVRRRGQDHERAVLAALRAEGREIVEIEHGPEREEATIEALRAGREIVYQGYLRRTPFAGTPDFLIRIDRPSALGEFSYEPLEAKLAKTPKPAALVQLCCYAEMLEAFQGLRPESLRLWLGNGEVTALRTMDFFYYYDSLRTEFLSFMKSFDAERRPVPESGAGHGRWQSHADAALEELDHLSRVAGITSSQVRRLESAGISTLSRLARIEKPPGRKVLRDAIYRDLHDQARLQVASAGCDRPLYEVILPDHEEPRGLALLPPASKLDVFFDMEGYPLGAEPLEYLFGACHLTRKGVEFSDWWAHDADEQKKTFEAFIDWIVDRWRKDPSMHVYHYGAYEVSAVRRLMGQYGTREIVIDDLIRNNVFVDLYRIVRDGIRIGEPRYSIKNVEHLYRDARGAEVSSAVDSIVYYDRWIESGESRDWRESEILGRIRDYNRDDCESTLQLAGWLRDQQREHEIGWAGAPDESDEPRAGREESPLAGALLARAAGGQATVHDEFLGHLVEFHRREDRPMWWTMFDRHAMTEEERIEDIGCLGGLELLDRAPDWDSRGVTLHYRFDPEQDTKLTAGSRCFLSDNLDVRVEVVELDLDAGRVSVRIPGWYIGRCGDELPDRISLIPHEHVPADLISRSIQDTAAQWLEGHPVSRALFDFLERRPPRILDHAGGSLVAEGETIADAALRVVASMDRTTLSIQGPPGTGKTTLSARIIVDLIGRGKRIGITSNSHKAILNLMGKCAEFSSWRLDCLKVSGRDDDPLFARCAGARHVRSGGDAVALLDRFALVGGTAWLFSRSELADRLDYLFVDEAGQVSVANLVGMARSARNIVLVGDQMQLPQPIQGAHPGESGRSTLDYLLGEWQAIPNEMGLFLGTTYRLHPRLCRFVSEAFYAGRLHSASGREKRVVRIDGQAAAGIAFVPVSHEGNTQASPEEVEVIARIVGELTGSDHTDLDGRAIGKLEHRHILVVAPYNLQVRKLRQRLPESVRVGTVDRFQGQEAPVVIVSMCASEGHGSPRGLEFLLQPNRLNVALSRAQSLAVVVGHPGIVRTRCRTAEQMRLVNLYCGIVAAGALPREVGTGGAAT